MTNIKYAGKDFRQDLGLYVDSIESYGTPKKSYTFHEVLGRNGSLAVDDHRFEDHEETFNCYIRQDFVPNFRNVQAFFNSLKGYQRLERSNEPDYFEMGLYEGEISPRPTQLLQTGAFPFRLRLHPEKWLKSGETAVDAASTSETLEGNPIQFDNPSGLTALTGLNVDIEPVQDLNGYDHPWAGGAGKNKAQDFTEVENVCEKISDHTFIIHRHGTPISQRSAIAYCDLKANVDYTMTLTVVDASLNDGILLRTRLHNAGGSYASNLVNYSTNGDKTYTFTPTNDADWIQFYIGGGDEPVGAQYTVADLMIRLASETDASYEPYSNICPITGHTSATVTRTGKNIYTATLYKDNRGLNGSGAEYSSSSYRIDRENLFPNTQYTVSLTYTGESVSQALRFQFYDADGEVVGSLTSVTLKVGEPTTLTFTTPSQTAYAHISINKQTENIQLEYGTTTSAYEAPQIQNVTVDLNGTRYGGTLNLTTGVLTVTHGYADLGSLAWSVQESGGKTYFRTSTQIADMKPSTSNTVVQPLQCSHYAADTWAHGTAVGYDSIIFEGWANRSYVGIADSRYTTAEEFKTAMNGVQLVYELAEPTTVQLTPQQISLLTGTNIISTDMNSLTVTLSNPAELENPTLFESKPIIRVYGNGTLNVNDQYITVANSPYTYIDIDCELMDCYYGSNNANQYVSFSTMDYVTLRSGMNYFSYSGFSKVEVTPRWFEV